jgi:tetratricopeptide (TPR) repeat protein
MRIGERLEQAYATNLDEIAAELAVHFEEARDVARAVAYLQRAAETSRRRSAYPVAEAQLRRALALLEQLPISLRRAERETEIRMALGSLLMAVRGWGSDEIGTHYDRALDLCHELGPTRHLFPSLWGLWLFHWGRGDSRKASDLATRLRGEVDSADSARVLQAHHAGWATSFLLGHLDEARCHAAAGSGLYRMDHHASLASAYGDHDAGTCALNFGARAAVLLGAVDEAVRQSDASLTLARELEHPFTLAQTLFFASTVHHAREDAEATRACASAGASIANEHGFRVIAAWSGILEGWSLVQTGRMAEGLSLLRDALSAAAAGAGQSMTYFMAVFAEAQLACSQVTEALRTVDEGLRLVDRTGERFYESELYRLRGELTLRAGGSRANADAECDFLRACDVSREQNARRLFLRAATSLAGIAHATVDVRVQLLTEALAGISEGLELRDVRIARELLDRLNADVGESQAEQN